jgi:hypothetical protein
MLPLAHVDVDRVDGVINVGRLDRLATTDCLHGDSGLEFTTVGSGLLIGVNPDQGRHPASEVNDGFCPEKPVHLKVNDGVC